MDIVRIEGTDMAEVGRKREDQFVVDMLIGVILQLTDADPKDMVHRVVLDPSMRDEIAKYRLGYQKMMGSDFLAVIPKPKHRPERVEAVESVPE